MTRLGPGGLPPREEEPPQTPQDGGVPVMGPGGMPPRTDARTDSPADTPDEPASPPAPVAPPEATPARQTETYAEAVQRWARANPVEATVVALLAGWGVVFLLLWLVF